MAYLGSVSPRSSIDSSFLVGLKVVGRVSEMRGVGRRLSVDCSLAQPTVTAKQWTDAATVNVGLLPHPDSSPVRQLT